MPSDASIYGMIRQHQPGPGPLELAGQGMQIRHMLDSQQLNALQRQQLEQAMAEDAAVKQAFSGMQPGQSIGDILPQLMRVSPKTGVAMQKTSTEQAAAASALEKSKAETFKLNMQQLRDQVASVRSDADLAMLRETTAKVLGPQAVADIPQTVADPNFAAWQQNKVLTGDKFLERLKPDVRPVNAGGQTVFRETNPNVPGFSPAPIAHTPTPGERETARHHGETERLAREAAERDKYGPPQEMTGPDGKQMLVMQDKKTGQLVDANTRQPVQGVGPKMGEQAQKQVSGVATVKDAITQYRDALKKWGATDIMNPNARARMGTIYNNMLLQAKEAYNLGVLNGPDYSILQEVITSPATLKGGITSKEALDDQAKKLDEIMTRVGQKVTQQQSGVTPPAAAAPPAPTRAQIDAELRRRGVMR